MRGTGSKAFLFPSFLGDCHLPSLCHVPRKWLQMGTYTLSGRERVMPIL